MIQRRVAHLCYHFELFVVFRHIHDFKLSAGESSEAHIMESPAIGKKETVNYIKKISNKTPEEKQNTQRKPYATIFTKLRELME